MNVFGYFLELLALFMTISAFRHAKQRDFLDDHGTVRGKRYAVTMRAVAVGSRALLAIIFMVVGLWLVKAFR